MVHTSAQTGYSQDAQAQTYANSRPDYPPALAGWLTGTVQLAPGRTVADVGAGTGKFTPRLLATGAEVIAVEPVAAMRERIAPHARLRVVAGTAEATGLGNASLDSVVCAQAFHWFASRATLDEFARVIRPGGHLGLVWNVRDESVDWVAAITRLIEPYEGDTPRFWKQTWRDAFPHPAFGPLAESTMGHAHEGPPEQVIVGRTLSTSFIAALPAPERTRLQAELEALIATHPALRDQAVVRYPYQTRAFVCTRR